MAIADTAWLEADRAALDGWLGLHVIARRLPAGDDSRVLAETALRRILPFADELPEELPFVGVHAPTKPAAYSVEPWIEAVEAKAGTPESGTLLAASVELGLLGIDPVLDRRAAGVIAQGFELDSVQTAMEGITRQALLDPFVGIVAEFLADVVAYDPGRRPMLRELCRHPAAFKALGSYASRHPSLAVTSVYLWAMVDRYPERRESSARTLLMLDPSAGNDVRALWGENGPMTHEEHAALLGTYHEAELEPPEYDVERALQTLVNASLTDVDRGDPLALALRGLPDHLDLPGYCAWYAAARRPGAGQRLDAWARVAARALTAREQDIPWERGEELLEIAAQEFIAPKTLDGYFEALGRLRKAAGEKRFDRALADALSAALEAEDDPTELLATMFTIWSKAPDGGHELHDRVLGPAARPYRLQDDEVRSHLGPRRQAEWDAWASHGRARFARVRARLRRDR